MKQDQTAILNGRWGHLEKARIQLFLVLFAFWLILFAPILPGLFDSWMQHSNNSHGILVPLICAFLIWMNKDRFLAVEEADPRTARWGLPLLVVSLVVYAVGYAGALAVVTRLTMVSSLIGLVIYNLGWERFRTIWFPSCFLVFMVPVPDALYGHFAFPLQLLASKVSAALIEATSIPVFREGNMLYFAETRLEVAEACSGLRSITAYIMLSVLFAYMLRDGWRRKILLVGLAIPLALFVNIVRVTGTGILAHFYGEAVARGFLHEFSGMAVFVLGLGLMSAAYAIMQRFDDR